MVTWSPTIDPERLKLLSQEMLLERGVRLVYHSLAAIEPLPEVLVATARDRDGEVMALRHRDIPHLHGVQFHPESVLTPAGDVIARSFLALRSAA